MANFDVSFLNAKNRKSASRDYGFLVDQLQIKEDQLASDGKLSPGDYDLLSSSAQELYAHPGLTPEQRSNVQVKIAGYKRSKNTTNLSDKNDISRINREVEDDNAKNTAAYANNPQKFLETQAAVYSAKIEQLSTSIDQIETSGGDATNHRNELNSTLQDYHDTVQALTDVKGYDKSGKSKSGFAAYVVTNSSGEVTGMKVGRTGGQAGYMPTNGLYGGLVVYGKANKIENGLPVFEFGNQRFVQTDNLVTGPDGVTSQKVLVAGGGGRGGISVNKGSIDVDPTGVRSQSSIRSGGWAEGEKGFLYQRGADGKYKKYVNADKTKLGIKDGDIVRIPRSFEQGIVKDVSETVDASTPISMPIPADVAPGSTNPASTVSAPAPAPGGPASFMQDQGPKGTPRTPAPVSRAPQDAQGMAAAEDKKGKGFFATLFS